MGFLAWVFVGGVIGLIASPMAGVVIISFAAGWGLHSYLMRVAVQSLSPHVQEAVLREWRE